MVAGRSVDVCVLNNIAFDEFIAFKCFYHLSNSCGTCGYVTAMLSVLACLLALSFHISLPLITILSLGLWLLFVSEFR